MRVEHEAPRRKMVRECNGGEFVYYKGLPHVVTQPVHECFKVVVLVDLVTGYVRHPGDMDYVDVYKARVVVDE